MSSPLNIILDSICSITATLCSYFSREVAKKYTPPDSDDDEITTDIKNVFNSSMQSMHLYQHKTSPVISRNSRNGSFIKNN